MFETGGVKPPWSRRIARKLGYRSREAVRRVAIPSEWQDRVAINKVADSVYLNRFVLGGGENERRLSYLPVQNITELQQPGMSYTPSAQLLSGLAAGDITLQVSYSPFRGFDPSAIAVAQSCSYASRWRTTGSCAAGESARSSLSTTRVSSGRSA